MKLFAYCTPSHEPLLMNYFTSVTEAGFRWNIIHGPQVSATGMLNSPGFIPSQVGKWLTYLHAASIVEEDEYFICTRS